MREIDVFKLSKSEDRDVSKNLSRWGIYIRMSNSAGIGFKTQPAFRESSPDEEVDLEDKDLERLSKIIGGLCAINTQAFDFVTYRYKKDRSVKYIKEKFSWSQHKYYKYKNAAHEYVHERY